jgi:DNA-binding beta-propeller fold protein YncE
MRSFAGLILAFAAIGAFVLAPSSASAAGEPLYLFVPEPPKDPPPTFPPACEEDLEREPSDDCFLPPTFSFNGPCGLTVDESGHFWVSDYYHRAISLFVDDPARLDSEAYGFGFVAQPLSAWGDVGAHIGPVDDPCALALDSSSTLYLNNYHRNVVRFTIPLSLGAATVLPGSAEATGVAVDPTSDTVYVAKRQSVAVYEPDGTPSAEIGVGTLGDASGVAVSGYGPTEGYVYVADSSDRTLKVFDPAIDIVNPIDVIEGSETPDGHFASLRDAAVAVDDTSGEIYVTDDQGPAHTEAPQGTVWVFAPAGTYEGHLQHNVFSGVPNGLAIDNSESPRHPLGTQGRVYVTTGNTHHSGVYIYPAEAATTEQVLPPDFRVPGPPLSSGLLSPTVTLGGPFGGSSGCEADGCQALLPEPAEPTLTTLLEGLAQPKVRYRNSRRNCARIVTELRRLNAQIEKLSAKVKREQGADRKRALEGDLRELRRGAGRKKRGAERCRGASGSSR